MKRVRSGATLFLEYRIEQFQQGAWVEIDSYAVEGSAQGALRDLRRAPDVGTRRYRLVMSKEVIVDHG
jgi:hypothetical protein